ncbi:MAG: pyruvate, phosphate dikinase [Bacilli bacterium]
MKKYVYLFKEGNKDRKDLLGGKGANLAEMTNLGLRVPNGFTVTTEACNEYYKQNETLSDEIINQIFLKLNELESQTNKKLGDFNSPLLLSIRSGSRVSMPGMMDTVLNLGLNDVVASSLINITKNKRFVYDSYRRFILMYSDVVKGYDRNLFEKILEERKISKNVKNDLDLDENDMEEITKSYKELYKSLANEEFPNDPKVQLLEAIKAVFNSWENERAKVYRKMNDIPDNYGTAVNIQEMVFGNSGLKSGTGVAFTRNPATGENKLYGEYLINAQGEDVVAGIRTPETIDKLKEIMPDLYEEFSKNSKILEDHYLDMQDMEFTIENGKLYMLQTRNGKRTTKAAIKIILDLINEGKISKEEAIMRMDPKDLNQLLHPTFDEESLKKGKIISTGLAASPGAGSGKIYFNANDVIEASKRNEQTVLVRMETSPEDISGMVVTNGILTIHGGMTSHAAVVARGMGRCCVSGCSDLIINEELKTLTTKDGTIYKEGDFLSLDGTTGLVYGEQIKTTEPSISGDFEEFMKIADSIRKLKIKVNADTELDAKQALLFGAEGIGLCRTEHMFFKPERIFKIRQMIIAEKIEEKQEAIDSLLQFQKEDFIKLFTVMNGLPITIRYLDPPLHEFLPKEENDIINLSKELNKPIEVIKERINSLKEFNPMMGHRGVRLDISTPELAVMQTKAIIEAAIEVKNNGIDVNPQIMIPLIIDLKEYEYVINIVNKTAESILINSNTKINYQVGSMIEAPRTCLIADELVTKSDFFSFGTNDLTQLTYGFSRDDASKYLKDYVDKKILEVDPFDKIDQNGVGLLVQYAVITSRRINKNIELGICGEHGGEKSSIDFFHRIGLDYVSCSPYRVPVARLAAAQAAVKFGGTK